MGKMKTITTVKSHYVGNKSLSEAFGGIIKKQIENNILQFGEQSEDLLKSDVDYGKINTVNLLSESEEVC